MKVLFAYIVYELRVLKERGREKQNLEEGKFIFMGVTLLLVLRRRCVEAIIAHSDQLVVHRQQK